MYVQTHYPEMVLLNLFIHLRQRTLSVLHWERAAWIKHADVVFLNHSGILYFKTHPPLSCINQWLGFHFKKIKYTLLEDGLKASVAV